MNTIRIFLVFIVIGLLGCKEKSHQEIPVSKVRDAQFVDEFLKLQFSGRFSSTVPLVIREKLSIEIVTIAEKEIDPTYNLIKEAESQDKNLAEAVKDFYSKNTGTNTVEDIGTLTVSHVIIKEEKMGELFKTEGKDGWTEFYKLYPKSPGIITLSCPGFSKDGSLAVILMANQSTLLAGYRRIYVLKKQDGEWFDTEISIGPTWVS
ncbi:MAG: hypothetical protein GY774_13230 [Planctomycetes bacterium]|nr:hypothetical protein [Planctomycetota bacterium]